jgi:transposase-like protein
VSRPVKIKEVTETRAGTSFSASSVSEMNRTLDTALTAFAAWRLEEPILPNPVRVTSGRVRRIHRQPGGPEMSISVE